jgi:hypothetical protein
MPVHILDRGHGKKDTSYVGVPGERCAECVHWTKASQKYNGPGEGACARDKGKETWGGALCPAFTSKKGAKVTPAEPAAGLPDFEE